MSGITFGNNSINTQNHAAFNSITVDGTSSFHSMSIDSINYSGSAMFTTYIVNDGYQNRGTWTNDGAITASTATFETLTINGESNFTGSITASTATIQTLTINGESNFTGSITGTDIYLSSLTINNGFSFPASITQDGDITASDATLDTLTVNGTSEFNDVVYFNDDVQLSASSRFKIGNTYGSSGQVLTSNGSGFAPTWQTVSVPGYYLYAYKNSVQTISNQTYTDITGFTVDSNASTTDASGDFATTTGRWTPPQGVYIIMCRSRVFPATPVTVTTGNISRVIFVLADTNNNQLYTDDNMNEENGDGTDIYSKTVSINTIIYANGATTYKLRMWARRSPSASSRVGAVSGTRDDTTITAYKIG